MATWWRQKCRGIRGAVRGEIVEEYERNTQDC